MLTNYNPCFVDLTFSCCTYMNEVVHYQIRKVWYICAVSGATAVRFHRKAHYTQYFALHEILTTARCYPWVFKPCRATVARSAAARLVIEKHFCFCLRVVGIPNRRSSLERLENFRC